MDLFYSQLTDPYKKITDSLGPLDAPVGGFSSQSDSILSLSSVDNFRNFTLRHILLTTKQNVETRGSAPFQLI